MHSPRSAHGGAVLVLFLISALLLLTACQETASVTGTVTYRERMALPPDAVVEVILEDVSRADAPAEVLGTVRLENVGQPPFGFGVAYDPGRIEENHSYTVRARIKVGERLLFVSDSASPVLTRGHGDTVDLVLRQVAAEAAPSLTGTRWKLIQLRGQPVPAFAVEREPHLLLEAEDLRLAGSGGCNRLTGSYELDGSSLRFGQVAATMMACPDGMEFEQTFLKALELVRSWRISGQELVLTNVKGVELARLVATE